MRSPCKDMSTSAPNFEEFDAFHEFYWSHPDSKYVWLPSVGLGALRAQGLGFTAEATATN